jgi:hypothetical protein
VSVGAKRKIPLALCTFVRQKNAITLQLQNILVTLFHFYTEKQN